MKGVGCRELVIDGKVGSIICFDEGADGMVYLVIFRRQDVRGDLPEHAAPVLTNHGKWAAACWTDAEQVFILLGDRIGTTKLATLF